MTSKTLLIIAGALLIVGCTTTPEVRVETQIVEVPIAVYPTIIAPIRPELEIDRLTEDDKVVPGVIANAYRMSIVQLRDYAHELELLINAVNQKSEKVESNAQK
jgi:hypothetical protein